MDQRNAPSAVQSLTAVLNAGRRPADLATVWPAARISGTFGSTGAAKCLQIRIFHGSMEVQDLQEICERATAEGEVAQAHRL